MRFGRETEYQGKGKRASKDPNAVTDLFYRWSGKFQTIGAPAKARVTATSFLPTVWTNTIHGAVDKVWNEAIHVHFSGPHWKMAGIILLTKETSGMTFNHSLVEMSVRHTGQIHQ